ncbi:solute carrier family 25 member 44 [Tribolium castaneum]|uniref:Calcium-binding mitochondrial carrier protein Aralar1-like Protein n=2 Tax=Tribolium castaneum TaxID=7070 RepID=A0A139WH88_TRICA|nr:PREDICTED: solute carrier family 25 member 44 [Tribolium castaneum]KYB27322.1 Calcium-binding mitochondrial carrier protein Aralar1-like Protein [Tribolium castaneum]|eukprot:XP_015835693.1 PREDICTED: solute carrier family 25 member 44 [Tribolium castaneum]
MFFRNFITGWYSEDMSTMVESPPPEFIKTIEWDMMDKTKFFPLSMLSSFTVRCALYPLTLIKTRLQVQKHNDIYTGMFDAYGKIYRYEGFSGLYRGFWVSSVQIISGVFYISVYEGVRHLLAQKNIDSRVRALIAGGSASIVGQTIIVPFDVLSQHLMMMGVQNGDKLAFNTLGIAIKPGTSKLALTLEIAKEIFRRDGIGGFYRGYMASLAAYVPNSALWWGFYHFYQDELHAVMPSWVSHLFIQTVAGTLGGFTTTIITNPLDVIRARLQVQRIESMKCAFRDLWVEEGVRMFSKGLSARLIQSATFSFSIILGYETIKRVSVNDEYKEYVRW